MLGLAIPGSIHLCLYLYQARMLQVLGRARHVTVFLMSAHNMTGPADQLRHCVWTARKRAVWMAMWDVDEVPARQHGQSAASVAPQLAALAAWGGVCEASGLGCSALYRGAPTPLWPSGSIWGSCQPAPKSFIPLPSTI